MFSIYSADVTGNPGNCSYPHKHVILNVLRILIENGLLFRW